MTSVIPPAWPTAAMAESSPYQLQQHPTQLHQQQHQHHQQQHHQQQQYQQQLYLPEDHSEQDHRYNDADSFEQRDHRQLLPINQEYDLNYPPVNNNNIPRQNVHERAGRDPALRSKTSKRVSKALPPDPFIKQRQRSLKNGSMTKHQTDSSKGLPSQPEPTSAFTAHHPSGASTAGSSRDENNIPYNHPPQISTDFSNVDPSHIDLVPYSPPLSKKGLPIDRPYSYYKVAPKVPQSVTVIDSPFGPPAPLPTLPIAIESPRNGSSGSSSSTYYTHPSQSNPFVPPAQYLPSLHRQQYQGQSQPSTRGDRSRRERPDPEDSIPVRSELSTSAPGASTANAMMMASHATRERSNSDRHFQRATSPHSEKQNTLASAAADAASRQLSDSNRPARSHSIGRGALQNRQQFQNEQLLLQQERQEPQQSHHGGHNQDRQDSSTANTVASQPQKQPTRKASGSNLMRIARQASGSAFRGIGLSRKTSDKIQGSGSGQKASSQTTEASTSSAITYEQNSQIWGQQNGNRSQPALNRGQYSESTARMDGDGVVGQQGFGDVGVVKVFDTDLGRNRSLPDIKPPAYAEHRTPVRGSSLTNPKTDGGPFHSRQRSQHHLQHPYQIATAMSNEPITATTSSSAASSVIQDAYGGTTDDWRQAQQAEKEARERQNLRDSSPNERTGHTSINSVSTLNLPPSTTVPAASSSLNRSTSRMLLPDRDRSANQSKSANTSSNSGTQEDLPEPTQESTSLAKAAVQHGGILAQLQAATEAGQVIDPAMGIWSQKEGRYIQRSNTAPYSHRENRTILEEDESDIMSASGSKASLEYSKSEGYAAASRNNRQQKRVQHQLQQERLQESSTLAQQPEHHPNQNEPHHQPQQEHSHQVHHLPHQAFHDQPFHHHQNQLQQLQHNEQQRSQVMSRSRAMSNELSMDTNKDLPPTPLRTPLAGAFQEEPPQPTQGSQQRPHQRTESRSQSQRQPRSRSESTSESSRRHQHQHQNHHQPASGWSAGTAITSEESVLALSRSMSPPPQRRISHERSGSLGHQLTRGGNSSQHTLAPSNSISGQKERVQYGIDMLPLPVIPSPDETLKKNANVGILPQDVLRTLDSQTVQKVITQAVIASRVYKALTLEEVESLKKEQEDLQKYVEALSVSLTIETRMRDASHSLIRLHESNTNIEAVKASTGQLHATTRKMDQIVQKTQQSMERLLVIQRLLLQHEGAVLNAGMRRLDGENRELSRSVHELETARDKEKEEKLKWKKEHSHLRIQSMIFPNPPGLEEYENIVPNGSAETSTATARGRKSPSIPQQQFQPPRELTPPPLQQQQHDARLAALENYMKELNEEINKKDERINQLESQLRIIKVWADDFAGSLKVKLEVDQSVEDSSTISVEQGPRLQKQLGHLQSRIEDGFRALEANAHEMKIKTQEAEVAKNKALEFAATTLANTSVVVQGQVAVAGLGRSSSSSSQGEMEVPRSRSRPQDQQQPQQVSHPSRLRGPYNRSKSSLNESSQPLSHHHHHNQQQHHHHHTHHNNNSDLNVVLNESLLELDLQISRDNQQQQQQQHQSHHHHQQQHSSSPAPSSSSNSSAPTPDVIPGKVRQLSRENSASQRAKSPSQQRQDLTRRTSSRSKQQRGEGDLPTQQQQEPKDELVIGDAHEEIKRLNAMVDELERLVKLKLR